MMEAGTCTCDKELLIRKCFYLIFLFLHILQPLRNDKEFHKILESKLSKISFYGTNTLDNVVISLVTSVCTDGLFK